MDYKDILAMASAYKEVAEASAKTRALQSIKAQPKDKVSLAKAPWEKEKEVKKEALDPVDQKALKGKHKDRKDKDIDNDGDTDSSDEYLHKRRKAVSKAMKGKGKEVEVQTQESVDLEEGAKEKALKALMTKALGGKRAKAGTTSAVAQNGDFVVKDGGSRIIGRLKAGTFTDPLKEADDMRMGTIKVDSDAERKKRADAYNAKKKTESVDEAKSHGNTDNGSPRGEGLSPSAKKELDRETATNPATDAEKVNDLNFKTFKAMAKTAPMRSGDNAAGDKTAPKTGE